MGLQIYSMRSKRKMRYQREDLEAIICIKLPGPWEQYIWKQIGTNVAGEYAAFTFRTEMSQGWKVAGYTNSERKEMSQSGTDHSGPGTGEREVRGKCQ